VTARRTTKLPIVTISDFPAKASTLKVEEIARLARHVEDVGLDRFAVTDWPYYFDCTATMAACLARSDRVVVESLVTTPTHAIRRRRRARSPACTSTRAAG